MSWPGGRPSQAFSAFKLIAAVNKSPVGGDAELVLSGMTNIQGSIVRTVFFGTSEGAASMTFQINSDVSSSYNNSGAPSYVGVRTTTVNFPYNTSASTGAGVLAISTFFFGGGTRTDQVAGFMLDAVAASFASAPIVSMHGLGIDTSLAGGVTQLKWDFSGGNDIQEDSVIAAESVASGHDL